MVFALGALVWDIKRNKRVAFGSRNFANYRIQAPLYAGRPDWNLHTAVAPHYLPMTHVLTAPGPAAAAIWWFFGNERGVGNPSNVREGPP